jgi:hypothetical protein
MIPLSKHIDLGLDRTRMKDPCDAARQTKTAQEILDRFFTGVNSKRWELQLLADEVGMGKTFVALAVAYSVLEAMDATDCKYNLDNCYQKILIVTPPNGALFNKWNREVGEFVRRCTHEDANNTAHERFQPIRADRLDDLVAALRRRGGRGARIVVTTMSVFGDRKLKHYDVKRRFLLGVLFRYWGHRFDTKNRERLLKGAPNHWPNNPHNLTKLSEWEASQLPFDEKEALRAIERIGRSSNDQKLLENVLTLCRDISEPYCRDRHELFRRVESDLTTLYRALTLEMLNRSFPLVIVDEAHNWKNGPSQGANGYTHFVKLIASRTRRLLLLTATPFQLRPLEMLEILRLSEEMEYAGDPATQARRKARMINHCEQVIRPALLNAERASRLFSKQWSNLPLTTDSIATVWRSPEIRNARNKLHDLVAGYGQKYQDRVQQISDDAVAELDPNVRAFFRDALVLLAFNDVLSRVLSKLVIRHRRQTDHRLVLVGEEYVHPERAESRPDRHILHPALGVDVRGDGELPHYLLMRCVTAMKQGKGRSSLGSALTGCYSTLLESAEGKKIQQQFRNLPESKIYFDTLFGMVRRKDDPGHPKIKEVVDATVNSWRDGEKTLIFCFRINTAKRLQDIINARIRSELSLRRRKCLGGEKALRALRGRMTRRDGDLITLGMDRVLMSLTVTSRECLPPQEIKLRKADIHDIARSGLRHGQDLLDEKVDRVFVHRAIERAVAHRLRPNAPDEIKHILTDIAQDVRRQDL